MSEAPTKKMTKAEYLALFEPYLSKMLVVANSQPNSDTKTATIQYIGDLQNDLKVPNLDVEKFRKEFVEFIETENTLNPELVSKTFDFDIKTSALLKTPANLAVYTPAEETALAAATTPGGARAAAAAKKPEGKRADVAANKAAHKDDPTEPWDFGEMWHKGTDFLSNSHNLVGILGALGLVCAYNDMKKGSTFAALLTAGIALFAISQCWGRGSSSEMVASNDRATEYDRDRSGAEEERYGGHSVRHMRDIPRSHPHQPASLRNVG